jgi:hypothetical protein
MVRASTLWSAGACSRSQDSKLASLGSGVRCLGVVFQCLASRSARRSKLRRPRPGASSRTPERRSSRTICRALTRNAMSGRKSGRAPSVDRPPSPSESPPFLPETFRIRARQRQLRKRIKCSRIEIYNYRITFLFYVCNMPRVYEVLVVFFKVSSVSLLIVEIGFRAHCVPRIGQPQGIGSSCG